MGLIGEAMQHIFLSFKSSPLSEETMEIQWKDYVAKLKAGMLSSALAMVDVSASMSGLPMQVGDLQNMDWRFGTDLNAAFDLILKRACDAKISQEQMVETLFIFSDMQFDDA
ncbi:TPA: hypothetical protein ACH3X1_001402 [Trebouxia sp. C0004]